MLFRKALRLTIMFACMLSAPCLRAQVGFAPEIGLGMSTMRFAPAIGFTSASRKTIFSGKLGGIIDAKMSRHLYFQAGFFVSRRGGQRTFSFHVSDSINGAVEQTLNIHYGDVPVAVVYKSGSQGRGRVILGIGVTPSYIIGGRNKIHQYGVDSGTAFNNNADRAILADGTLPLARFDIGVNLSAGYELATGLYLRAYYTSGIQDIGRGSEIDKNRMWGISAGYMFGKGRNINKETEDLIDKGSD